jgi:hypothetical protein
VLIRVISWIVSSLLLLHKTKDPRPKTQDQRPKGLSTSLS